MLIYYSRRIDIQYLHRTSHYFRFLRRNHRDSGSAAAPVTGDKNGNTGGVGGMGSMNIFRNLSVGGAAKPAPPAAPVLSEEEKALRRERLSAAAQVRSEKKLGQKKTNLSHQTPIVDIGAAEPAGGTHADTERAIRKTKELEVRIEQVRKTLFVCAINCPLFPTLFVCVHNS